MAQVGSNCDIGHSGSGLLMKQCVKSSLGSEQKRAVWCYGAGALGMRPISTEGLEKPPAVSAGAAPELQWLPVADLVVDASYRRQEAGKGRRRVNRIARNFSWSHFTPVVVARGEQGKFVIVDGENRATAAALAGFAKVPCQIINASREEQALAFKTINGTRSRMASHAAAMRASDPLAVEVAEVCLRADVELLRYPVPVTRQLPGQTMAIGAIAQCLRRYGAATLITALQCVTRTTNRQRGALSARMIKALCEVLDSDPQLRDSGLALLEAFDAIDLIALQRVSLREAVTQKTNPLQVLVDAIRGELGRFPTPANRLQKTTPTPRSRLHLSAGLRQRAVALAKGRSRLRER